MYKGQAEYDTLKRTRDQIQIPLIANGDITTTEMARNVMRHTGADAVMIGRGTQGDPWLPGLIAAELAGIARDRPPIEIQIEVMASLLSELHHFYGPQLGVKIARKHLQWFLKRFANGADAWSKLHSITDAELQFQRFKELIDGGGLRDGTQGTGQTAA
jgi:tRNA-dihydrouridine synthase